MKITFANSYWPNSIGFIGFMLALALMVKSCNSVHIEQEKTKQKELELEILKNKK